jgi:predicted XRE-type DNA-binding protein
MFWEALNDVSEMYDFASKEGYEMRMKQELKEQLLSALKSRRGEQFSPSQLLKIFPIKKNEGKLFAEAFHELIDEKRIVNYVSYVDDGV